jgi:hypothetical protein
VHWKAYLRQRLGPFVGERVLEVGAGLGAITQALCGSKQRRWVCLEPDLGLAEGLARRAVRGELPAVCEVQAGNLATLDPGLRFDTVLYVDVLEHIEHDAEELLRAASFLTSGGALVVLAPAHAWLYTSFDRAIGHLRRYTKRTLAALTPPGLHRVELAYLDSVGLLASLGNRFLLRADLPTARQIWAWDRWLVPLSRITDPLLGHTVGKSVLGVWRRS